MAQVILTTDLSRQFAGGETLVELEGENIRQIVRGLDERFPGIGAVIRAGMIVAIDGQIYSDPFLEPVQENSEVCFLPPIGGG